MAGNRVCRRRVTPLRAALAPLRFISHFPVAKLPTASSRTLPRAFDARASLRPVESSRVESSPVLLGPQWLARARAPTLRCDAHRQDGGAAAVAQMPRGVLPSRPPAAASPGRAPRSMSESVWRTRRRAPTGKCCLRSSYVPLPCAARAMHSGIPPAHSLGPCAALANNAYAVSGGEGSHRQRCSEPSREVNNRVLGTWVLGYSDWGTPGTPIGVLRLGYFGYSDWGTRVLTHRCSEQRS